MSDPIAALFSGSGVKRCAQCGRLGTRQFRTMLCPPHDHGEAETITVCANTNACRNRWPRHRVEDE